MKHNIVFPLSPCLGKLRDGTELRYALRGLARHFKGEYEVTVIGPKKPDWYHGRWIEQKEGRLKSALRMAAKEFPAGFFWWYDDCVLIADQTPEECMITPCREKWGAAQTTWGNKLEKIRKRLVAENYKAWDYSRPHGPYWYDGSMIDETWADWSNADLIGKFPFESWILSKRDWPRRFGVEKQYYGAWKGAPEPGKIFVNWCDRGFTTELQGWLAERFPEESPEEIETKRVKVEVHTLRYGDAPQMHNKTIHFIWIGNSEMPLEAHEIVSEWKNLHPEFQFKFWGEKEVEQCSYASANVKDRSIAPILRADLFRLEIMANEGGVYVDLDIRPYKNCWDIFQKVDDFCYSDQHPLDPINALFMARGKSITAQAIRDHIGDISRRTHENVLSLTGPAALKNALEKICDYSNGETISSIGARYGPILRLDFGVYFASAVKSRRRSFMSGKLKKNYQYGVHLYAGSWKSPKRRRWQPLPKQEIIEPKNDMDISFDMTKYPPSEKDWAMDDRHIYMLYREAVSEWEGTRVAVEIGSHKGRSTMALVEALNEGKLDHLHIVEISVKPELLAVLAKVKDKSKFTIHQKPACDCSITRADFVFIDGSHDWWAVSDTLRALAWGAKVICAHDSNAFPRMKSCWGSHHAAQALKIAKGRTWTEDCLDRPGEHTWRGFFVSREL